MNYYRRYIGDYQKKTPRLSMLEHGAYNLLLDHYYGEEQPIPLDMGEVYTMVRAMSAADRKAVDKVLAKYFTPQADGYHNVRADQEIEVAKQARENGKGGGRPRTKSTTGSETGTETGKKTKSETGTETGNGGGSGHPPTTSLQPPTANLPTSPQLEQTSAAARRAGKSDRVKPDTGPTWAAYREAYGQRYEGVQPSPNAEDNSHMLAFVQKVPLEEAPHIAAFYVRHNKAWYVENQHPVRSLRNNAVGLRTQWLNQRQVTSSEARQADQTSARGDQALRLIKKHGAA